jgi:hypothetical protein
MAAALELIGSGRATVRIREEYVHPTRGNRKNVDSASEDYSARRRISPSHNSGGITHKITGGRLQTFIPPPFLGKSG